MSVPKIYSGCKSSEINLRQTNATSDIGTKLEERVTSFDNIREALEKINKTNDITQAPTRNKSAKNSYKSHRNNLYQNAVLPKTATNFLHM